MTLTPLFAAGPIITIHALLALALVPLTVAIFTIRRGSKAHKTLGWLWIAGMGGVALSSFGISTIKLIGPFSPIHLLSIFTLASLAYAVVSIRSGQVRHHRLAMIYLVWGALAGAGAFTLLPNRIMFAVVTGG